MKGDIKFLPSEGNTKDYLVWVGGGVGRVLFDIRP